MSRSRQNMWKVSIHFLTRSRGLVEKYPTLPYVRTHGSLFYFQDFIFADDFFHFYWR